MDGHSLGKRNIYNVRWYAWEPPLKNTEMFPTLGAYHQGQGRNKSRYTANPDFPGNSVNHRNIENALEIDPMRLVISS